MPLHVSGIFATEEIEPLPITHETKVSSVPM